MVAMEDLLGPVAIAPEPSLARTSAASEVSPERPSVLPAAMADTLSGMVDNLVQIDALISGLNAVRAEMIDGIRAWSEVAESASERSTPMSRDLAFRAIRAEVACALRLPERTVENLFGVSRMIVHDLPETLKALRAGEITYRHAQILVDHAAGLDGAARDQFERLAVPVAVTSTPTTLDRRARKLREGLDPDSIAERTQRAVERREATWSPAQDGMGYLTLYLPAADGSAIFARATDAALHARTGDEPRTLTQLRLDVMRDALMDGTFAALGGKLVRPDVFVTVPVLSLMGVTDEPASLDGYGPIDAETARRLAGNATSFVRLLVHPETGAVLSVGRDRYVVPSDLKNALRVRHSTCAFVGCSRSAEFCDLDHTVDWARDGTTSYDNLAPLCRGHHTVKHHTAWTVTQEPGGSGRLTWTSPAGRSYVRSPESRTSKPEIPPF